MLHNAHFAVNDPTFWINSETNLVTEMTFQMCTRQESYNPLQTIKKL